MPVGQATLGEGLLVEEVYAMSVMSPPRIEPLPDVATDTPAPLPPPEPAAPLSPAGELGRRAFRVVNRWLMLPLLRAGLGAWLGTPFGGWLMLLRVRGRKSGRVREVPLGYYIAEGSAWVIAGFGGRTDWYLNLRADPRVEVILPGRERRCVAEDVTDPETRRRILPPFLRSMGVPGYLAGLDPYRSTPDELLAATATLPLIRLRPEGEPLVAGPDDPGGLGWVWRQALVLLLTARLVGLLRRLVRPKSRPA